MYYVVFVVQTSGVATMVQVLPRTAKGDLYNLCKFVEFFCGGGVGH